MTSPISMARKTLMVLAMVSAFSGFGVAKTVPVVPGQVIGQVEVPDNWTVNRTPRGIEIKSPDEEIIMWMEVFRPDQADRVRREHRDYFTGQGVRITGPAVEQESVTNGIRVLVQTLPATWNGAPTLLAYQVYGAATTPAQMLLISYWASPEGDRRYGQQVQAVLTSTNFTLR
jgi:hypothetical protein